MRRKPLFPPRDAESKKRLRHKGSRRTSVLTVNGRVALSRRAWRRADGSYVKPAEALAGLVGRTVSAGACELICRLNQSCSSFQKAADNISRAAQIRIGKESVRQLVEAEGRRVQQLQQSGQLTPSWEADTCRLNPDDPQSPSRVYVGTDGVKVPIIADDEKQKRRKGVKASRKKLKAQGKRLRRLPAKKRGADQRWKEFKVVVFYDEGHTHSHSVVTRRDHRMAQVLISREARRLGLTHADEKVAVVDGADWIRHRLHDAGLNLDAVVLDFFHLAENIHRTRRETFGEQSPEGKQWAGDLLHTAKHDGYEALRERLTSWRSALAEGHHAAADRLIHYITDRRAMLDYPQYVERGWQIGSGPTEAMCKTTTARIKGSGKRWDADNAEAVANLAALEQSDNWQAYWKARLKAA